MYAGKKFLYICISFGIIYILWKAFLKECWLGSMCKLYPPPKNERHTVKVVKHYDPRIKAKTYQRIPRIIIQTNEKDTVPVKMLEAMNILIEMNPEYEYMYFDNEDVKKYLLENFDPKVLAAYNKLKPGAYKADLFRYCILYKMGGVYIDSPMLCKRPLADLIMPTDEFISPEDNQTGGIYNAFICSSPGNLIMKKCIEEAVSNIENEFYGSGDLTITGPQLLSSVFENVTGHKVSADKNYGNGIRLITHYATHINLLCPSLTVGHITNGETEYLTTRYPNYCIDRIWYNTNKHYSALWKERDVFNK